MNDTQLYFAIGVPALFALIGIGVNVVLYVHLSSVMNSRFGSVDNRFDAMEHSFEVLTGKVIDIDNRLTRIEERLAARA